VGFTLAAPMADGGGLGGSARARGVRSGRVYMGAEGRLGGSWGQPRRRCTRGVGSKALRREAARRPMACGGWHADEWKLSNWRRPNTRGRQPQWHSGATHGPLDLLVPRRARAARVRLLAWHACATSRVGALWSSRAVGISLNGFQNCFSPIFQTKVHHKV
jgi:hypothetical protein